MTTSEALAAALFNLIDARRDLDDAEDSALSATSSGPLADLRDVQKSYLDACDLYRDAVVAAIEPL